MPTFKLPEAELTDMKQFYEDELDKTLKRLQHIKSVLDQLGGSTANIDIRITTGASKSAPKQAKRGPKPGKKNKALKIAKAKSDENIEKGKPGRKSIWETVVLNRLEQLDKPVTYDELTQELMTFSNLPESKRKSTKQALLNVAFRLRTKDKKIDTFSNGSREKYLALNAWFVKKGQIKPEYAAKVSPSATPVVEAKPAVKILKKRGPKPKVAKAVIKPITKTKITPKPKADAKAPAKKVEKKVKAKKIAKTSKTAKTIKAAKPVTAAKPATAAKPVKVVKAVKSVKTPKPKVSGAKRGRKPKVATVAKTASPEASPTPTTENTESK